MSPMKIIYEGIMATPKENELILSCRDLVTQPNEKVTKCNVVEMRNSFSMAHPP